MRIRNKENDDIINLYEDVEVGIVDMNRGVIVNVEKRKEVELKVELMKGYVIEGKRKKV